MFKSVTGIFRKLLPGVVLLTLTYLAGGTDVFSSTVHEHFSKALSEYGSSPRSLLRQLPGRRAVLLGLLGGTSVLEGLVRASAQPHSATDRIKSLVTQSLKLSYWFIAAFISLSFIAPDLLSKVFLASACSAPPSRSPSRTSLATPSPASSWLSIRTSVSVTQSRWSGTTVKGKIRAISYVQTSVETDDGIIVVPNGDMWSKSVKVYKAAVAAVTPESGS